MKAEAFCNLRPIWAHLLCRPRPNLLNVPASGRKETHASPICFWRRRFGESLRNSPRVAALADCWRLRFAVAGGIGGSLQSDPSELNSQKAIGRKERKGTFVVRRRELVAFFLAFEPI